MRFPRHDWRDIRLAFALAFDLRRVAFSGFAIVWTALVAIVVLGIMSWQAGGTPYSAAGLIAAWDSLVQAGLSPWRLFLCACVVAGWWIGFGYLTAPVMRSAAIDIARDTGDPRPAVPRLSRQAALAPLLGLIVPGLALLVAALWALSALIPGTAGAVIAAILLPVALVATVFGAAVLIVVLYAAPMMGPAAVVEGRDYFEAVSRPISYAIQQPGRYFVYLLLKLMTVVVSALVGGAVLAIGWLMILGALWIVGLNELVAAIRNAAMGRPEDLMPTLLASILWASVGLLAAWVMTVSLIADLLVYLLMRYRVDGVTFDAITDAEEKLKQLPTAVETAAQAEEARRRWDEQQAGAAEPKPEAAKSA
jgi:hypothetical protein